MLRGTSRTPRPTPSGGTSAPAASRGPAGSACPASKRPNASRTPLTTASCCTLPAAANTRLGGVYLAA